jgi:dTDP-glucose pyrophosphorylase
MKYSFVLKNNTTFSEIVTVLDGEGVGFLALVDEVGSLLGIVTDGDVRRSFLNKNECVEEIFNRKPHTMDCLSSDAEIIFNLKKLHRRHMPLVNEDNKLIRVFALDNVDFYQRENTVIIMAGGLGTRLGELTQETPKPMLHVAGKPMILHIVEALREQGFFKFVFCVNYKKEKIKDFFKDGKRFGVEVDYIEERERLGTAGALSLIKRSPKLPFIVMNADVMTNLNFGELVDYHDQKNDLATMCLREYKKQIPFGVVVTDADGVISEIREKPDYTYDVNAGIYVLNSEVLKFIPKNEFYDMPTLFEALMKKGVSCNTYNILGYWMDLGRKEDLEKAEKDIG